MVVHMAAVPRFPWQECGHGEDKGQPCSAQTAQDYPKTVQGYPKTVQVPNKVPWPIQRRRTVMSSIFAPQIQRDLVDIAYLGTSLVVRGYQADGLPLSRASAGSSP